MNGHLSDTARRVLENLQAGRRAYDGLLGHQVQHIGAILGGLQRKGYTDQHNRPTQAGVEYLARYEA